jgi:SWI/SNF-related matrix-associated actin-dependent regulator of chromatin subfamily A3
LYSLCRFLRIQSLETKANWTNYISKALRDKGSDGIGMSRLQALMKLVTLRRMKDTYVDGKPILDLPNKTEETIILQLTQNEREYYDNIHKRAKNYFEDLLKTKNVMKNYVNLLEAILRMRQAATHRRLIKDESWLEKLVVDGSDDKYPVSPKEAEDILEFLQGTNSDNCGFCNQDSSTKELSISPCRHPYFVFYHLGSVWIVWRPVTVILFVLFVNISLLLQA